MKKNRLEAFSDGVLAIIITIMVLELKTPHAADLHALIERYPLFISYIISFIYIAIYWNNHHHLLHTVSTVNGSVLWANNHLLFWLSLIPFVTAWSGENNFAAIPVLFYGVVLFMAAFAYYLLTLAIIRSDETKSVLQQAVGNKFKEKASIVVYVTAIPLALVNSLISLALYTIVAIVWIIPDKRIEKKLRQEIGQ